MLIKGKTLFAPTKKMLAKEKKLQSAVQSISENRSDDILHENLVHADTVESGLSFLSSFSSPPKIYKERQKLLREKIEFKNTLYKEVITEAVANIVMAGLVFDPEYIAENKERIFDKVFKLSEDYLAKTDTKNFQISILQELSENIQPYITEVTNSYFNGDGMDVVSEAWDAAKATVFGELMIEGFHFYDTVKESMKNTLLREKQISEEIKALQKEENERRIITESDTGRFEDFSNGFKSKIDRISKPTPFQKLIEKVSEKTTNTEENEILAECTILYTMMETANILKLRSYATSSLNATIKEIIDFNFS